MEISKKSRTATFLMAFFLGTLGIHRFYVGKNGTGLIQLLLAISIIGTFVAGIWAIIDCIIILTGNFKDKEDNIIKNW